MSHDRFGFKFWLGWILWFAGTLLGAVLLWTGLMEKAFGQIQGWELTATWCLAVFGSWFVLLTPFMRKKEQIWKRINYDQEKAINVWLVTICLFIGTLILSAFGWSYYYREALPDDGVNASWLKAVVGTWLVAFLPFLVVMYKKADQVFKAAEERQTKKSPKFKTQFIPKGDRTLSPDLVQKLRNIDPTLENGHIVNVTLVDGQHIPHVFVYNQLEILGIYDCEEYGFKSSDVKDVEPIPADQLPAYDESKWLRLDCRL